MWFDLQCIQFPDRNLNPKAACLKRREEEKALRLTSSISDAHGNSLIDTSNLVSSMGGGGNQPLYYAGTSPPPPLTGGGRSLTPTQVGGLPSGSGSSSQPHPFSYTPSPPSLTSSDKIPRRSDPPMKRRSSVGTLSPTLRKNKGRLPIHSNALMTLNPDIETISNPVSSS